VLLNEEVLSSSSILPHCQVAISTGSSVLFSVPSEQERGGIEMFRKSHDTTITLWTSDFEEELAAWRADASGSVAGGASEERVIAALTPSHALRAVVTSLHEESHQNIHVIVEECIRMASSRSRAASTGKLDDAATAKLQACLSANVYPEIHKELDMQLQLRQTQDGMSARLRNYSCADPSLETSLALSSSYAHFHDKHLQVDTLMHTSHSGIWTIHDFISPQECEVLKSQVASRLQRAVTLGGVTSESRRAQQAGYLLGSEEGGDPLWDLYRRVLISPTL
jgi:hypothetical protein